MSQPSSSASQPIPFSAPGTVSQGLTAWSSLGIPSSHSRFQDATNLLGLNLPPNALRIIAQYQDARRHPPTLLNPLQQSVQGAAKPVATSRTRPTARSHSQPNVRKSRVPSAYSRGVVPRLVAQPPEAALYLPPPMKARNRRAAKSRAKATAHAVAGSPPNPNWSASAVQAASQDEATPNTASQPAHNYSSLAKAIFQQPGLKNIPITLFMRVLLSIIDRRGTTSWVALPDDVLPPKSGVSNFVSHSESPSPPRTEIPAMERSPLLEQPRFVPAIGGDGAGDSMAFSVEIPMQFPGWYHTMDAIPEWEMPATGLSTMEAPTSEPELPPATSQMLGEFDAIIQSEGSDVTTAAKEQNDGEELSAAGEYPDILDTEHSLAVDAALPTQEDIERSLGALPNNLSPSAELGRDLFMGEAGGEGFEQVLNDILNGSWEKLSTLTVLKAFDLS